MSASRILSRKFLNLKDSRPISRQSKSSLAKKKTAKSRQVCDTPNGRNLVATELLVCQKTAKSVHQKVRHPRRKCDGSSRSHRRGIANQRRQFLECCGSTQPSILGKVSVGMSKPHAKSENLNTMHSQRGPNSQDQKRDSHRRSEY
jgi:hypothetical protein